MSTRWTAGADGWEVCRRRDGSTDYRLLVSDTGTPRFNGAARKYAEVHVLPDGNVLLKSAAGYIRAASSIEEAKAAVGERQ